MPELKQILREKGLDAGALSVLRESDGGTVWTFNSPGGNRAVDAWRKLREIVAVTGHWPVILGDSHEVPRIIERNFQGRTTSVRATLDAAAKLNGGVILIDRQRERLEEMRECNPDERELGFFAEEGEWPGDATPHDSFVLPFDTLTRKPFPAVAIAMIPTPRPWEVPAFLGLGGWNECPSAEEHIAVMKRWNDLYGAEIVGASQDVVEMKVGKPPTDRASALELAREQYIYCPDVVDQGTETIANLAGGLLGGSAWFFWWD